MTANILNTNGACGCDDDSDNIFTTTSGCTFCDGVRVNNVWVEGHVNPDGTGGLCLLDTYTKEEIIDVLSRDPRARADLKTVTTNQDLIDLVDTIPLLNDVKSEAEQANAALGVDAPVFYTLFRGVAPWAG